MEYTGRAQDLSKEIKENFIKKGVTETDADRLLAIIRAYESASHRMLEALFDLAGLLHELQDKELIDASQVTGNMLYCHLIRTESLFSAHQTDPHLKAITKSKDLDPPSYVTLRNLLAEMREAQKR